MSRPLTRELAAFTSELRYEDIPPRVIERTKAQFLSVLGAIHAGRHSEAAMAALATARSWGAGTEATCFATAERLPRHGAIFANACLSVAFDFDDYLFAGHTGHSAVCASLAYGERNGATGRDVLAAAVAANEVGGRLGAAFLFGPQNGQMWAYIHQLEGACVAARMLGLDETRTADAVGIALAQPVYPLVPAFMGPESKLLIPSQTTVEGTRAAELAAAGWRGSHVILEDHQGMLKRFNRDHLGRLLSGYGEAWVSDSLTYKVVPGCAYIDTAVDALLEILERFELDRGRRPKPDEIQEVEVRCGTFTAGMEGFSQMYRSPDRLAPITVNFSVALSFGMILASGALTCEHLSHAFLDEHRRAIEAAAAKVRMEHDPEMDERAARAGESQGFSLRTLLGESERTLEGTSFEGFVMAFPAAVALRTSDGSSYEAEQDVPLGGAGRPWDETLELVRQKFLVSYDGDRARAAEALEAVERLEDVRDIREVAGILAPSPSASRRG